MTSHPQPGFLITNHPVSSARYVIGQCSPNPCCLSTHSYLFIQKIFAKCLHRPGGRPGVKGEPRCGVWHCLTAQLCTKAPCPPLQSAPNSSASPIGPRSMGSPKPALRFIQACSGVWHREPVTPDVLDPELRQKESFLCILSHADICLQEADPSANSDSPERSPLVQPESHVLLCTNQPCFFKGPQGGPSETKNFTSYLLPDSGNSVHRAQRLLSLINESNFNT